MLLPQLSEQWQMRITVSFDNCTEAYKAGYSNIPASSTNYGEHLDRDGDGFGCDNPPSWFTPRQETQTGTKVESGTVSGNLPKTGPAGEIGVGAAAVLVGVLIVALVRRRKTRFTA